MSKPLLTGRRTLILGLWVLVAAALGAVLWLRAAEDRRAVDPTATLGRGDYRLTASDGSTFTEASLKGAPSAVFFGFTHCPDVCPTTLGDIATWEEELAREGASLRAFFITVDPERDTPAILGDYVSWVPAVTAVSGSRAEIDKALKAFRIYSQKVPLENGDYSMDHSASVLLFDARGRFFEPIGYQEDFDRVMAKIRRMLGA